MFFMVETGRMHAQCGLQSLRILKETRNCLLQPHLCSQKQSCNQELSTAFPAWDHYKDRITATFPASRHAHPEHHIPHIQATHLFLYKQWRQHKQHFTTHPRFQVSQIFTKQTMDFLPSLFTYKQHTALGQIQHSSRLTDPPDTVNFLLMPVCQPLFQTGYQLHHFSNQRSGATV